MSRGGYLNLWEDGNYDAEAGTITVYVIDGDNGTIYADSDFAAANAAEEAENSGEPCAVLCLTLKVMETEVVYTAEP